jgi:membrane-associated protein
LETGCSGWRKGDAAETSSAAQDDDEGLSLIALFATFTVSPPGFPMHAIIDFLKNLYSTGYLQHLAETGGVPLLSLIVFAETGLLVGFFLPGDTMLFVAGVAAAQIGPDGQTYLNLWVLNAALIAAAVVGDQLGYFLGYKTGHAIFTREEGFFFKRKHAVRAHEFYTKYGLWAVLLAKFAPVLRTFVPFMAGVGEMNYRKYLLVDSRSAAVWITLVVQAGYHLGHWPGGRIYCQPQSLFLIYGRAKTEQAGGERD